MANRLGYNPDDKTSGYIRLNDAVLAGVLVGASSRFILQPFDVMKIRYQLQSEARSSAKYKSLRGMVLTIATEEGLTAFWKGHMPAQYLSMIYMGVQFGINEKLTKRMFDQFPSLQKSNSDTRLLALSKSACGAPSALCATLVSYPFDVIRTRRIAQLATTSGKPEQRIYYTSTLNAAKLIYKLEGPLGLFRGITPQLVSMAPYTGLAFGSYEFLTQTCYRANWNTVTRKEDGQKYLGFYSKCLCSATAGVLGKSATYPFDTVRKRLQVQGFGEGRLGMGETPKYSGMSDCFVKIYRTEGVKGFFKGIIPGSAKAALSTILYMQLYEHFKEKIADIRKRRG